MSSRAEQLARLRGAPSLVLFLLQDVGCWVVGSRADFQQDRITPESDWDILVPWDRWRDIVGSFPLEFVTPTKRGGWRITRPGWPVIDVFPEDLERWFRQPLTSGAWHPESGTVLEKRR